MRPHICDAQRRARLGTRHRLGTPASSGEIDAVVDDLVALHATDPATVFLSLHARLDKVTVADIEHQLYRERTLLRTLAMRRTLFVATRRGVPVVELSSSTQIAAKERAALEKWLAGSGISKPADWLQGAFEETLAALGGRGYSARELTKVVPRLATKITIGGGKYSQQVGATSKVVALMAAEGLLARGRPSGSWTGRQYTWHARSDWFDPRPIAVDHDDQLAAEVELVRWWLERFGPGTMTDLRWWTGWTATRVKAALAELATTQVSLDDGSDGIVLAGDVESAQASTAKGGGESTADGVEPWVALLPALDPTAMGWKDRSWYIGPNTDVLFDRNGNIGPTIWANGHLVGLWAQRLDASIVTELFVQLTADEHDLLEVEITRLASFLDGVVVKPSFPTPGFKRLATSA